MVDTLTYAIGDKMFTQRALVLGQVNQLTGIMKGITFPADIDAVKMIALLSDKLPAALAIVLLDTDSVTDKTKREVAEYLSSRDLDALAKEIAFMVDPETTIKVIEDFFDCNPIPSLLARFTAFAGKVAGGMKGPGSSNSSA
jgi:hypothetical protein